jgi:excisionase family DNA binding protein
MIPIYARMGREVTRMADSTYKAPDGYMTLAEARTRLGVAKATITRMVQDGRLPTFDHPRDRRVKLAKIEDIERLAQPQPRAIQEGKAAA